MYLKKLTLQGFKSFANKTVLNFEEGNQNGRRIAAIVGPNGSGKSNIADAVRWVLGEQSLKALRGRKTEDIIFAGTDQRSRLGSAEVSLYLDNSDQKMPLDYTEVVLTRRVFRDGNSEYLINQNPVRRFDVIELLAKAGFGQATYAVVGQGMVDAVLSATPVERKVLFEEATGVKKYYLKRDRAARKLESARANLVRVKDIITELEPRLRILKRQAKRAQERGQVETELKELQKQYYTFVYRELDQQLNQVLDKVKDYQSQLDQGAAEMEELKSQIQNLDQATKGVLTVDQDKQEELTILQEKQLDLRQKIAVLDGKIEAEEEREGSDPQILRAKHSALTEELAKLNTQLKELNSQKQKLDQKLQEIEQEKANLNQKLTTAKEQLQKLTGSTQANGQFNLGQFKTEVKNLLGEQSALLVKLESITDLSELESLNVRARGIQTKLKQLDQSLAKQGQTNLQEQLDQIQATINNLINKEDSLDQEANELKIQGARIEQKLEFLNQQRDEKQSKWDELEMRLKETDGEGSSVVTGLIQKKETSQKELTETEAKIKELRQALTGQNQEYQEKRAELLEKERTAQIKQQEIEKLRVVMNQEEVEKVRFETRLEDLKIEIEKELGTEFKVPALPAGRQSSEFKVEGEINKEELELKIQKLKRKLELSGGIDPEVIREYEECQERYDFLATQSADLKAAADSLSQVIRKLDALIKKQFNEYFAKISLEFNRYFRELFSGGEASLILQEDAETSESAVEIKAHLPGKRIKTINSLSGGERALTSVALLFAILAVNPSPFCVLDEVDAALDEANSKKFGDILESLAEETQFVLVTHNRETMRRSYLLYGVTMEKSGVSQLLSIKLEEGEELVKQRKDYQKV